MLPLPAIALTASDYPRLEKLARIAAQQGDMDAMLLLAEINRAEIAPDDAHDFESMVTIGSWVTYLTDWGIPRKTVQLVWPEDCRRLRSSPDFRAVELGRGVDRTPGWGPDAVLRDGMHERHQGSRA